MGKIGRFACILTPMVLTIASVVCLALVLSAQLNEKSKIQRELYFFKADTKEFNADPLSLPDVPDTEVDNKLLEALQGVSASSELKDFYQVGLWNYCEGTTDDAGKETITFCSPRKANFWFNPVEVWGFGTDEAAGEIFSEDMRKGLDVYRKVAVWMFAAYIITAILTVVEFLVGIFAIFSRWGSVATTIVSTAQTIFFLAAAATSTAVYGALVAVFGTAMKPYNIKSQLGVSMLAVVWIGAACSIASCFFWLISSCCCSGASSHKKVVVEKAPYTYERVASPYLGGRESDGHQMHAVQAPAAGHGTSGSAYEPYRHQGSSAV